MNYSMEFDTYTADERYYITVDEDKKNGVIGESKKVKNWTG